MTDQSHPTGPYREGRITTTATEREREIM